MARLKPAGMLSGVTRYLRETRSEVDKVIWPTRNEATNLTIVVIAVTLGMAIFLGALDFLFQEIFALLFR